MRFNDTLKPPGTFPGMPFVPITLRRSGQQATVDALVDSGANISILPYDVGHQLGFLWEEQHRRVYLGGAYHTISAYAVLVYGQIPGLPEVPLAMAWVGETEQPIRTILGQANFFHSMFKFLGNLFKFKAEKIFDRRHTPCIPRNKKFFQHRSWANEQKLEHRVSRIYSHV